MTRASKDTVKAPCDRYRFLRGMPWPYKLRSVPGGCYRCEECGRRFGYGALVVAAFIRRWHEVYFHWACYFGSERLARMDDNLQRQEYNERSHVVFDQERRKGRLTLER